MKSSGKGKRVGGKKRVISESGRCVSLPMSKINK